MTTFSKTETILLCFTNDDILKHKPAMFLVAMAIVHNVQDAEDIVQTSIAKAIIGLPKFRGECPLKSWLFIIVRYACLNVVRGRKAFVNIDTIDIEATPPDEKHLHECEFMRKEIEKLPPKQKAVFIMRVYKQKTFTEISKELGCPYDTAKANYLHAFKKIQKRVKEKFSI